MAEFVAIVSWASFFIMLFAVAAVPKGDWAGYFSPVQTLTIFFITAVIASAINADYEVKGR